jgi:hypothetical protein
MTSNRISARMTYVMWQEHLWNVSVFQRVHLSNLTATMRTKIIVGTQCYNNGNQEITVGIHCYNNGS